MLVLDFNLIFAINLVKLTFLRSFQSVYSGSADYLVIGLGKLTNLRQSVSVPYPFIGFIQKFLGGPRS